jgi:hypothetical protein
MTLIMDGQRGFERATSADGPFATRARPLNLRQLSEHSGHAPAVRPDRLRRDDLEQLSASHSAC